MRRPRFSAHFAVDASNRSGTRLATQASMTPLVPVLATLVLLLLAPAVQANRLLYVDDLAVYDATGRQIGSAWPTSDSPWVDFGHGYMVVEFRLGSRPVILQFRP